MTIAILDDQNSGTLKQKLNNAYAMGNQTVYPTTVDGAIQLINNFSIRRMLKAMIPILENMVED